eukprot:12905281-Prorocentrum_lima.AAC.1
MGPAAAVGRPEEEPATPGMNPISGGAEGSSTPDTMAARAACRLRSTGGKTGAAAASIGAPAIPPLGG